MTLKPGNRAIKAEVTKGFRSISKLQDRIREKKEKQKLSAAGVAEAIREKSRILEKEGSGKYFPAKGYTVNRILTGQSVSWEMVIEISRYFLEDKASREMVEAFIRGSTQIDAFIRERILSFSYNDYIDRGGGSQKTFYDLLNASKENEELPGSWQKRFVSAYVIAGGTITELWKEAGE